MSLRHSLWQLTSKASVEGANVAKSGDPFRRSFTATAIRRHKRIRGRAPRPQFESGCRLERGELMTTEWDLHHQRLGRAGPKSYVRCPRTDRGAAGAVHLSPGTCRACPPAKGRDHRQARRVLRRSTK